MRTLKSRLKTRLSDASRVAVLGVGSELKSDDAAGVEVVRRLRRHVSRKAPAIPVILMNGSTAPENFTGEIRSFGPSHLVIVDAASVGGETGDIDLIDVCDVSGLPFCTHMLPASIMIEYIRQSMPCEIVLIGIRPRSLEFGGPLSPDVARAAGRLAGMLSEIILHAKPLSLLL